MRQTPRLLKTGQVACPETSVTTRQCCVTSQKSEDLISTAAEASVTHVSVVLDGWLFNVHHRRWRLSTRYKSVLSQRINQSQPTFLLVLLFLSYRGFLYTWSLMVAPHSPNRGSSKIKELREKLAVTDWFFEKEYICILANYLVSQYRNLCQMYPIHLLNTMAVL
jgi:hypothetical protein